MVLFADIIGCSEISNHKTPAQYNAFLQEFHATFREVTENHRDSFYSENEHRYFIPKERGDEGCLMICIPGRDEEIAEDVDTAICIALDLKRRWLLSTENSDRIKRSGLLPIELAIGIHIGRALINESPGGDLQPEGYAINLTKRIEGASRMGQFTHVYVSEAAHGELDLLRNEQTYTFCPPVPIPTKGISQEVRVFEVKHHFLPTDWIDLGTEYQRTRALDFDPTHEEVASARQAHHENPTNLWLAEEFIMLSLQREYKRLEAAGEEEDEEALKEAYAEAERVCRRLATGEHRDAGVLTIAGFIAGEHKDYATEQDLYGQALDLGPQYAEARWYFGYSLSRQLYERLRAEDKEAIEYEDLPEEDQAKVREITSYYRGAIELKPQQAWVRFDLAAELARWARDKKDKLESVEQLALAVGLYSSTRHSIADEPYFESIRDDPKVRNLLRD